MRSDTGTLGDRCIGGAAVKNRVCAVVALVLCGAFGTSGAVAEEMTVAPAAFITSPASRLPWTGFYIGGNGGFGWDRANVSYAANDAAAQAGTCGGGIKKCIPQATFSTSGPLAGGQAGFNWQMNSMWLIGMEADYQWADLAGNGASFSHLGIGAGGPINLNMMANQTINSFGTVRARTGAILANLLLLYGTGGLAFGRINETVNGVAGGTGSLAQGGFSYSCVAGTTCFAGSSSKMMVGWTVGGGVESALTSNLTLKGELLYVDLSVPRATVVAQNTTAGTSPASFIASFSPAGFLVVRGGLNVRF
jgi:outer membrane immunogenic protein